MNNRPGQRPTTRWSADQRPRLTVKAILATGDRAVTR